MDVNKEYERWLASATADVDVAAELKTMRRKAAVIDVLWIILWTGQS